jgi:hypothetical protein
MVVVGKSDCHHFLVGIGFKDTGDKLIHHHIGGGGQAAATTIIA